jgi:hypothetical protein
MGNRVPRAVIEIRSITLPSFEPPTFVIPDARLRIGDAQWRIGNDLAID